MATRTTGQCVLGDLATSVTSVVFNVNVVIDSAGPSAAAWKKVFDTFLRGHAEAHETAFTPFDPHADYLRYLHGRSPLAGARDFLAARDVELPYDDLRGLVMSQEEFFSAEIRRHEPVPFPAALALVGDLRRWGVRTAAVSMDRAGGETLRRAGVADMFDVVMDGLGASLTASPDHPGPQPYLQVASRLHTTPGRTAVIEVSTIGVAAAHEAGFGAVIGVDHTGGSRALGENGADTVIADLSQLRPRKTTAA